MKKISLLLFACLFCFGNVFSQDKIVEMLSESVLSSMDKEYKIGEAKIADPSSFGVIYPKKKAMNVDQEIKTDVEYKVLSPKEREAITRAALEDDEVLEAYYMRPRGFFYVGLTETFVKYIDEGHMFGPAYVDSEWINLSTGATSYEWTVYSDSEYTVEYTSPDKNVITNQQPINDYSFPQLKANSGSISTYYSWADSYNKKAQCSYFLGGNVSQIYAPEAAQRYGVFGLGNYDADMGYARALKTEEESNEYLFGTNSDNDIDAIANYFEKPVQPYFFSYSFVHLQNFSAPQGTEFKMIIHKLDENNNLGDTLAYSTCYAEDVQYVNNIYTMPFKKWEMRDPATGLLIDFIYVEISDAILVEITGFNNQEDVVFSPFMQLYGTEANAYVFGFDRWNRRVLRDAYKDYGVLTSFLVNFDAWYSYLYSEDTEFEVNVGGGTKEFRVNSLLTSDSWERLDNNDWISYSSTNTNVTLSVGALPDDEVGRYGVFTLDSHGGTLKIVVKQGDVSGIDSPEVNAAKAFVVSNGNEFEVSYAKEYTSVAVYNISGQLVGNYTLPADGKSTIPSSNLTSGIYLFKFVGKGTETVKVVK